MDDAFVEIHGLLLKNYFLCIPFPISHGDYVSRANSLQNNLEQIAGSVPWDSELSVLDRDEVKKILRGGIADLSGDEFYQAKEVSFNLTRADGASRFNLGYESEFPSQVRYMGLRLNPDALGVFRDLQQNPGRHKRVVGSYNHQVPTHELIL